MLSKEELRIIILTKRRYLPREKHDVRMDILVTDKKIYRWENV